MISVIVPFRDSELWLNRCLSSLAKQKGDFEFILVDDNRELHTDTAIADRYEREDKRFRYFTTRGKGVSIARNTGICAAKGDWITFLDADDEWNDGAMDKFELAISEAPSDINIIQMNHYRHYDSINKTAFKYTNTSGIYSLNDFPKQWCMVWNKLYRRDFIKENAIRFPELMQYGEDEIFNLKALDFDNRICHAPRGIAVLKRHFQNKRSLSHTINTDKLIRQSHELIKLASESNNQSVRLGICKLLSEHWHSKTYTVNFGGDRKKDV